MPRQSRQARARLPGLGQVSGPQVTSRVKPHELAQENSQIPMQGLQMLQASLQNFQARTVSALDQAAKIDYKQQAAEIDRINMEQKAKGQSDALQGRPMSNDPGLKVDYDYLDAYKATAGKKAGLEAVLAWQQEVADQWSPEKGDIKTLTDQWVRENYGDGTGDPLYDQALFTSFYQSVADPMRSVQRQGLKAFHEKAVTQFNETLRTSFLANQTYSGADFMEDVSKFQALAGPTLTKGQAAAHVLARLEEAAVASESPETRLRLQSLIDSEPLDDQGRTFMDLFPDAGIKLSAKLIEDRNRRVSARAQEKAEQIDEMIMAAKTSNDPELAAKALQEVAAYRSRYGHTPGLKRLQVSAASMLGKVAKETNLRQKHAECASGGPCRLSSEELRDLPERLRPIDPLQPGLTPDEAQARIPQYAKTLFNYYQGLGKLPPSVSQYLSQTLLNTTDTEKQGLAFRTLGSLEELNPGMAHRALKGDDEAIAKFDLMWSMRNALPIPQLVDMINQVPDLADRSKKVDLTAAFSKWDAENPQEAKQFILEGNPGIFNGWGDDSDESLVSLLMKRGVVSAEDGPTELAPAVQKRAVNLFRLMYAASDAMGLSTDPQAIREKVADVLAKEIEPQIIPNAEDSWFGLSSNDKVILTTGESKFQPADPNDARLAPIVNKTMTNPEGNFENPYETLLEDSRKVSNLVGDGQVVLTMDDKASKGLVQLRVDEGGGMAVPLTLPIGREFQVKDTESRLTLSGDPQDDLETMRLLGEKLDLPDNLVLVKPTPASNYYQVYMKPVWRDLSDDFMSEQEMRRKANDPNWQPKEEKSVIMDIMKRFRSLFQEKGALPSTEGLTKPDPEASTLNSTDDVKKMFDETTDKVLQHSGPAGLDTDVSDSYEQRRFDFIVASEGFRAKVYDDMPDSKGVTRKTVGYGFNMDADGAKELFVSALGSEKLWEDVYTGKKGLTREQARKLFDASVREAERYVATKFKGVPLNEHQRLALVSLAYNNPALIGPNLTRQVKEGKYDEAMKEILYRSNRTRSKGLARRRYEEAQMFAGASARLPDFESYIRQFS